MPLNKETKPKSPTLAIPLWIIDFRFNICSYDDGAIDSTIGLVVECSPMGRETGVQSQVESYQRLKK